MQRTVNPYQAGSTPALRTKIYYKLKDYNKNMKFTVKTGYKFDRGDVKGFSYNTKEQFNRMSAAKFVCKGKHPSMKSLNSDRLYLILEGKGTFVIDNKKIIVKKNEVVVIPRNTPYRYFGDMECFLVHSPAFDREKEVRL